MARKSSSLEQFKKEQGLLSRPVAVEPVCTVEDRQKVTNVRELIAAAWERKFPNVYVGEGDEKKVKAALLPVLRKELPGTDLQVAFGKNGWTIDILWGNQ